MSCYKNNNEKLCCEKQFTIYLDNQDNIYSVPIINYIGDVITTSIPLKKPTAATAGEFPYQSTGNGVVPTVLDTNTYLRGMHRSGTYDIKNSIIGSTIGKAYYWDVVTAVIPKNSTYSFINSGNITLKFDSNDTITLSVLYQINADKTFTTDITYVGGTGIYSCYTSGKVSDTPANTLDDTNVRKLVFRLRK